MKDDTGETRFAPLLEFPYGFMAMNLQSVLEADEIKTRVTSNSGIDMWGLQTEQWTLSVPTEFHARASELVLAWFGQAPDTNIAVDSLGRCMVCHYEMQGLIAHTGVCPECGTDLAEMARQAQLACMQLSSSPSKPGAFARFLVMGAVAILAVALITVVLGVIF